MSADLPRGYNVRKQFVEGNRRNITIAIHQLADATAVRVQHQCPGQRFILELAGEFIGQHNASWEPWERVVERV